MVYVLNCIYSVESLRFRVPEFESQSFFFLAYLFVLRENLNFSRLREGFFYFARAQFICKRIQSKYHADAVQMQKIHNLCTQEKEVGLTISLDQAKERTSTEARVSLSG